MELMNAGENEVDEMEICFDFESAKEMLWFSLSKDDARELIIYLKKQFGINL